MSFLGTHVLAITFYLIVSQSSESFFYCAVNSYRNVFVAKNYTMLFDSTQRPLTLVVKSNQSNPSFRHVTPRSTKVLVKTCTSVQIKKIKVY